MAPHAQTGVKGARILLTGGAGFIGFHVCDRLIASGGEVLAVDNLNNYYDVGLKRARLSRVEGRPGFAFRQCDVADQQSVLGLFDAFKPEYVVHLAAQAGVRYSLQNPAAYTRSNIDGFLSILEACRAHPVRHLIYASSSSVYGASSKVPFSEDDRVDAPLSLYAATKRASELMAQTYSHLFDIPASGLRFFTVYGPWGRPDMAYFSFTKAILEGRTIDVYNSGRMQRDFTYITDVIEAIERLIPLPPGRSSSNPGQPGAVIGSAPHTLYNIGNHTPVELGRFIAILEAALGRKADCRMLPMQPGEVPVTCADVRRLADAVGFAPHTPIEDGVRRFVSWYREYYRV